MERSESVGGLDTVTDVGSLAGNAIKLTGFCVNDLLPEAEAS